LVAWATAEVMPRAPVAQARPVSSTEDLAALIRAAPRCSRPDRDGSSTDRGAAEEQKGREHRRFRGISSVGEAKESGAMTKKKGTGT